MQRDFLNSGTLLLADMQEPELGSMPIDPRFDRIVRVARAALRVAAAGITVERNGAFWFRSVAGWDIDELSANRSLCHRAREAQQLVLVPDTLKHPGLAHHPLVTTKPRIRFYAGYPLQLDDGACVGTLCLADTRPRALSGGDLDRLRDLASIATDELRLIGARRARPA